MPRLQLTERRSHEKIHIHYMPLLLGTFLGASGSEQVTLKRSYSCLENQDDNDSYAIAEYSEPTRASKKLREIAKPKPAEPSATSVPIVSAGVATKSSSISHLNVDDD